jgi:addiction module HigA family antidote
MKVNGSMFNPPHPGEFIAHTYLEGTGLSGRVLAGKLGVTPSTLQRILSGSSGISPEMALRLSIVLGRSAESWLAMQDAYDLWQARARLDLDQLKPLTFEAAS